MRFPSVPCILACLSGLVAAPAQAGPEPYFGDIIMVGQQYCPRGWLNADGSVLPIANFTTLYSLLGTTYGGDGINTFALPDLRGRVPVGLGTGPGLPPSVQGEIFGADDHILTVSELPQHNHIATSMAVSDFHATTDLVDTNTPTDNKLGQFPVGNTYNDNGPLNATLETGVVTTQVSTTIGLTGGSRPFELYQPSLSIRFCIANDGLYPPRS